MPSDGHVEIGSAGRRREKLRHDRYRRAKDLEPLQIEGDRAKRSSGAVDQMAARQVSRRAAAPEQDFLRAGLQVEHGDFRVVDATSCR